MDIFTVNFVAVLQLNQMAYEKYFDKFSSWVIRLSGQYLLQTEVLRKNNKNTNNVSATFIFVLTSVVDSSCWKLLSVVHSPVPLHLLSLEDLRLSD